MGTAQAADVCDTFKPFADRIRTIGSSMLTAEEPFEKLMEHEQNLVRMQMEIPQDVAGGEGLSNLLDEIVGGLIEIIQTKRGNPQTPEEALLTQFETIGQDLERFLTLWNREGCGQQIGVGAPGTTQEVEGEEKEGEQKQNAAGAEEEKKEEQAEATPPKRTGTVGWVVNETKQTAEEVDSLHVEKEQALKLEGEESIRTAGTTDAATPNTGADSQAADRKILVEEGDVAYTRSRIYEPTQAEKARENPSVRDRFEVAPARRDDRTLKRVTYARDGSRTDVCTVRMVMQTGPHFRCEEGYWFRLTDVQRSLADTAAVRQTFGRRGTEIHFQVVMEGKTWKEGILLKAFIPGT